MDRWERPQHSSVQPSLSEDFLLCSSDGERSGEWHIDHFLTIWNNNCGQSIGYQMVMVRAHVFISGLVQGVSFRYYIRQEAQALGLSGWVRNLPDGRVEAAFEGEKEAVNEMIAWCWSGSPTAQVTDVKVGWEPFDSTSTSLSAGAQGKGFEIRR